MKLNILILLVLLCVSTKCQQPRLHNVIREAPVGDDSQSEFLNEEPEINPTQLIIEKNGEPWTADTVEEAPASVDVHNKNNHCGRREGWVGLISPLEYQWKDTIAHKALHAKQVFVELTNESITFYANHNVNSVIQTLLLRDVAMPILPEEWKKYGCLQLKYENKDLDKSWYTREAVSAFDDHLDKDAVVSFCVGSLEGILHWAKDIWDFPRCVPYVEGQAVNPIGKDGMEVTNGWTYNGIAGGASTYKIRVNSQKDQLTQYQLAIAAQKKALVSSISDQVTQTKEEEINHRYEEEISRINEESNSETVQIQKISTQIEDDINIGIKKQTEERRRIDEEKHQMEGELDKMKEEKECLQQLLRQRQQSEVAASESMIREEQLTKEETILQKTRNAMLKEQDSEMAKAQQLHATQVKEIKQDMEKVNEEMVQTGIASTNNIYNKPYCNNNGSDKAGFITSTCEKISKVQQQSQTALDVSQCTNEAKFCDTCCGLFIGSGQVSARTQCSVDCNSYLTPAQVEVRQPQVTQEQAVINEQALASTEEASTEGAKKFLRF